MSEILPVSRAQMSALGPAAPAARTQTASAPARSSDRVELSGTAQLLSKLHSLPDIRQELVDRVRGEIAAGTYETDEKIDGAIDGLAEDIL